MAMFNLDSPDQGVAAQMSLNMREFKYGDNYKQAVADGINPIVQTFSLTWSNRPQSTINAIDDFLRSQLGAWFYWTTPRGELLKFTCKQWVPNTMISTCSSLTATFEQSFEP